MEQTCEGCVYLKEFYDNKQTGVICGKWLSLPLAKYWVLHPENCHKKLVLSEGGHNDSGRKVDTK